ncbi:ORMDL family-domain-containing protein, partial [Butyriboletus roseoflavus]
MSPPPTIKLPQLSLPHQNASLKGRKRSGSIVKVEEVGGRVEELLDRSAYVNINANWVNAKGAWLIHVVLVFTGKIIIDTLPGITQQISWTLVNLIYLALSYLMFHWVTGIPFDNELHAGAYDDLTLWEQIDDGAQYTPSKKWLFTAPILLFLASTALHELQPLLPQLHRQRVRTVTIPKVPRHETDRMHIQTGECVCDEVCLEKQTFTRGV